MDSKFFIVSNYDAISPTQASFMIWDTSTPSSSVFTSLNTSSGLNTTVLSRSKTIYDSSGGLIYCALNIDRYSSYDNLLLVTLSLDLSTNVTFTSFSIQIDSVTGLIKLDDTLYVTYLASSNYILEYSLSSNTGSYALLSTNYYVTSINVLAYDRFTQKLVFGGQCTGSATDFLATIPDSDLSMSILYQNSTRIDVIGTGKPISIC